VSSALASDAATPTPTAVPVAGGDAPSSFTSAETEALAAGAEKFEFQAEVSRLMDIIINS
jgi:hypothetical protein